MEEGYESRVVRDGHVDCHWVGCPYKLFAPVAAITEVRLLAERNFSSGEDGSRGFSDRYVTNVEGVSGTDLVHMLDGQSDRSA